MLFFTCLKLSRFVYFKQDYFLFKKCCEMEGDGGDGRDGRGDGRRYLIFKGLMLMRFVILGNWRVILWAYCCFVGLMY